MKEVSAFGAQFQGIHSFFFVIFSKMTKGTISPRKFFCGGPHGVQCTAPKFTFDSIAFALIHSQIEHEHEFTPNLRAFFGFPVKFEPNDGEWSMRG